jgi:hypothetical protein
MTTLGLVTHAVVLAFESHDRGDFSVVATEKSAPIMNAASSSFLHRGAAMIAV